MIVLAVAPHPDDETLGCGGALLRHISDGDSVHWLIATEIAAPTWTSDQIERRQNEISQVADAYGFDSVHSLGLPTTKLDSLPLENVIKRVSEVFVNLLPELIYLPHRGDAHSDHKVIFDAVSACTKWFRYPSIRQVLAFETLSETRFSVETSNAFEPTRYVDISRFIEKKIAIMEIFKSEMAPHPFPRSREAIRALATLRGGEAGFISAEAFQVLRQRIA